MRLVLIMIPLIFLIGCGKNDGRHEPSVIIFGDSLAADPEGWAEDFAKLIGKPAINFAKPGTRFEQTNQISQIMSYPFGHGDVVVFQPGMNDMYIYATDASYLANYKHYWEIALRSFDESGAVVLIGTTSRCTNDFQWRMPWSLAKTYGDIPRELIAKGNYKNIHLVDIYTNFNPDLQNMANEVHPNANGYYLMAQEYMNIWLKITH